MANRTYRYFKGGPLYEFGYGLSYTSFRYSDLKVQASIASNETARVTVQIENTGNITGDEVVELYATLESAKVPVPIHALKEFARIPLKAGEKKIVEFRLRPEQLSLINDQNRRIVEPGQVRISVGGRQPSQAAVASGEVLSAGMEITGGVLVID